MSVNDQQGEQDEATNQQHNDDGPVLPNIGDKSGEIVIHPPPIYTRSSDCQPLLDKGDITLGFCPRLAGGCQPQSSVDRPPAFKN